MSSERRRFGRLPFFVPVALTPNTVPGSIQGHTFDISLGGAGLTCPTPLPVGESVRLAFHLPAPAGRVVEELTGRVASLRFDDDGAIMGVEFDELASSRKAPALTRAIERLSL